MSRHTYTKRCTSDDGIILLLAGIRMLRHRVILPSAEAFDRVVNEGLLDGAPDVTICGKTFTESQPPRPEGRSLKNNSGSG
ncbi:hypothetical protein [Burkholderia anthina]|uniref:hypothetical protein n=1 Tax=Burkholderia anthina TaxID=179879 RepID=UPI0037C10BC4